MNLLMIQNNNKHGMKTTSSDVLSMASSSRSEDEEDEGVATDATTDKDITKATSKAKTMVTVTNGDAGTGKRSRRKTSDQDGLAQGTWYSML